MSRITTQRVLLATLFALTVSQCRPASDTNGTAAKAPATPGNDFASLLQSDARFEQADPTRRLVFPRDHGAHPSFQIEWWYLTANLTARQTDGATQAYGAQWTLFRLATRPHADDSATASASPWQVSPSSPWASDHLFMAHMAVTWPDGHRGFQRYARGPAPAAEGVQTQAGVSPQPFSAWLDDWTLNSTGAGFLPLSVHARQDDFGFELSLHSDQDVIEQGQAGFSQKHPAGGGSHYYSHPFLKVTGQLWLPDGTVEVNGQAWLDHEWSSQFLQADQQGWDWFALHLDSGEKLMLFRLRPQKGQATGQAGGEFRHGVLISPNGVKHLLEPDRTRLEPTHFETVAGRSLPMRWSIALPEIGRQFEVRALHSAQWMKVDFPYWEGVVEVLGEGAANRGRGYLEMTGYPVQAQR